MEPELGRALGPDNADETPQSPLERSTIERIQSEAYDFVFSARDQANGIRWFCGRMR